MLLKVILNTYFAIWSDTIFNILLGFFLDKPIFSPLDPYELTGLEGEPFVISVSARGNPNTTEYTWTRDGLPLGSSSKRIAAHGSTLNITRLDRHDAGTYICEALNKEGTTFYQLNLTVQCKCKG